MKYLIITIAIIIGTLTGLYIGTQSKPVTAAEAFDHSNCQYPYRQSNPPNGCDNTDPARPECMKGGTEDCSIPPEPAVTPEPAPAVANPKKNQCQ